MLIYNARHFEKNDDVTQYPTDAGTPLSHKGKVHASEVGHELAGDIAARTKNKHVTIIQSPMLRTRQSANGIAKELKLRGFKVTMLTDERIANVNKGEFYGLSKAERLEKWPEEAGLYYLQKNNHENGWLIATPPGGESKYHRMAKAHEFYHELRTGYTSDEDRKKADPDRPPTLREFGPDDTVIIMGHSLSKCVISMELKHESQTWFRKEPEPAFGSVRLFEGNNIDEMKDHGEIIKGQPDERRAKESQQQQQQGGMASKLRKGSEQLR